MHVYVPHGVTWSMLMMSLVRDGSERPPTATVDAMLRSLKRTSVVATGAPTLRREYGAQPPTRQRGGAMLTVLL